MAKFKGIYRIETTRLKNYDYGSHGLYFVTICCKDRDCYFGEINHNVVDGENVVDAQNVAQPQPQPQPQPHPQPQQHHKSVINYIEMGKIAIKYWQEIPEHYPFVELDEFVVMTDHVHGILFFNRPDYHDWQPNRFGPQSKNLGAVIRGYKAGVKKYATLNNIEFTWQSRYHDHIIRNAAALHNIRKYITHNPAQWLEKSMEK